MFVINSNISIFFCPRVTSLINWYYFETREEKNGLANTKTEYDVSFITIWILFMGILRSIDTAWYLMVANNLRGRRNNFNWKQLRAFSWTESIVWKSWMHFFVISENGPLLWWITMKIHWIRLSVIKQFHCAKSPSEPNISKALLLLLSNRICSSEETKQCCLSLFYDFIMGHNVANASVTKIQANVNRCSANSNPAIA